VIPEKLMVNQRTLHSVLVPPMFFAVALELDGRHHMVQQPWTSYKIPRALIPIESERCEHPFHDFEGLPPSMGTGDPLTIGHAVYIIAKE